MASNDRESSHQTADSNAPESPEIQHLRRSRSAAKANVTNKITQRAYRMENELSKSERGKDQDEGVLGGRKQFLYCSFSVSCYD